MSGCCDQPASGESARRPQDSTPGLAGFELDQIRTGAERVRRAGHRLDGDRLPTSLGLTHPVSRVDHQVAEGVVDPQLYGPAVDRIRQPGDGSPVVAMNKTAEARVQLGRSDPTWLSEVQGRRRNRRHLRLAIRPARVEEAGGGHSQLEPVDRGRSEGEVGMEPHAERSSLGVGVDRLEHHGQPVGVERVGDLEFQLPLVSRLGSHRARQRDRRRLVRDR